MTDSAVERLVTPGTEACWWEDNGAGKVQDTQRHQILQKVCMENRSETWKLGWRFVLGQRFSSYSYLEETGFYYLEKLNQKGSRLWIPGIIRIDGRPGTKVRKFPCPFFHPASRIPVVKPTPLIRDWTVLNWRNRITKEKRSTDSGNWKSSNKKLRATPGIL